ncbi:MAG TPA: PEGA domain-containing protein [Polyangiaceae bacterium]|nr:PEGA domain-containing protein [Polyangiaceae bacterium]
MRVLWFLPCALGTLCAIGASHSAVAAPGAAHEDAGPRERSRAAFRRGVARVKAGDYAGARDAFEEAYRLFAHPSILLNLGLARVKIGEYVEAEQNLLAFLLDDGGAAPEEQRSARAALATVRAHLGTLSIQVNPAFALVTLDGKTLPAVPGSPWEVRVVAGEHALHAEVDGYTPFDRTVTVSPGASQSESIGLVQVVAPEPTAPVESRLRQSRRPSDDGGSNAAAGWGLVVVGLGSAGFGTYAGLRALSLSRDYERTGASDTKSTGITFRTLADVSYLVAIASTGIGVYLLLLPRPSAKSAALSSPRSPTARFVVLPGQVTMVGSF